MIFINKLLSIIYHIISYDRMELLELVANECVVIFITIESFGVIIYVVV